MTEKNSTKAPKEHFDRLYKIIKKLRHPEEGCSWDLKQTAVSLRTSLLEEVYECIDAIDKQDDENLKEELGDMFLLLVMISRIKEQESRFTVEEVLHDISEKLVRRHPHVFGDVKTDDVDEILQQWDDIKENLEGKKKKESILEGITAALPPLEKSFEIQKKVAKVGFQWDSVDEVWEKMEEEIRELKEEHRLGDREKMEQELGDILFTVVNLARMMKIDPALALNRTNNKFVKRFQKIEERLKEQKIDIKGAGLPLLDSLWDEVKKED